MLSICGNALLAEKAVPINELNTDGSDSKMSDLGLIVFMGCAIKNNQIVPIIARQLTNTTTGIVETIYTLKSINAKTPNIGTIGLFPTSSSTRRLMRVNIRNLLNEVKNVFPEYLSQNVRETLGVLDGIPAACTRVRARI